MFDELGRGPDGKPSTQRHLHGGPRAAAIPLVSGQKPTPSSGQPGRHPGRRQSQQPRVIRRGRGPHRTGCVSLLVPHVFVHVVCKIRSHKAPFASPFLAAPEVSQSVGPRGLCWGNRGICSMETAGASLAVVTTHLSECPGDWPLAVRSAKTAVSCRARAHPGARRGAPSLAEVGAAWLGLSRSVSAAVAAAVPGSTGPGVLSPVMSVICWWLLWPSLPEFCWPWLQTEKARFLSALR